MRGILAFVAASMAGAVGAQAPEPALPPRYEVEVIVFAHRDFDPTEERFAQTANGFGAAAALREAPVFDETTFAAPPEIEQTPLEQPPLDPAVTAQAEALLVRPLRPEELKLGTEYRRLRAISAYRPLAHFGWVQPGLPEADSMPIDIGTLGVINPRGTMRVHLARYLHITLDLTYQGTGSVAAAPAGDGLDEIVLAPYYRLTTTRSARSNELHYFDHPAFGVLVRITPVPTPDGSGRRPAA